MLHNCVFLPTECLTGNHPLMMMMMMMMMMVLMMMTHTVSSQLRVNPGIKGLNYLLGSVPTWISFKEKEKAEVICYCQPCGVWHVLSNRC